jgi:hypothetical protein
MDYSAFLARKQSRVEKPGRRAIGIELKPSYWRTAVENLTDLESEMAVPSLFDEAVAL